MLAATLKKMAIQISGGKKQVKKLCRTKTAVKKQALKRSELVNKLGNYRLSPSNFGNTCIMINEEEYEEAVADSFDMEPGEVDVDSDPNDRPQDVEIWEDAEGNCYGVVEEHTSPGYGRPPKKTGEKYLECDHPNDATYGGLLFDGRLKSFDDEDEDGKEASKRTAAEKLPVVFRKFKKEGDVIALFPTLSASVRSWADCESYMHVGQHGAASTNPAGTVPATPEEYQDLLKELNQIYQPDYELVVYSRVTAWMDEKRKEDWKKSTENKESSMKEAAFSKQHFIAIAKIVASIGDAANRREVADKFVSLFSQDNAAFRPAQFLAACGVDTKESSKTAAFMEPDIQEGEWVEIDGGQGTEAVPSEYVDMDEVESLKQAVEAEGKADLNGMKIQDYFENRVISSIEVKTGWGARMSAPGYMDSTPWAVFATEADAVEYLKDQGADDEDMGW
jgi:hypothetical protein